MTPLRRAICVTGAAAVLSGVGLSLVLATPSRSTTQTAPIVVVQTRIIYEPDQAGGPFHEVFALVRNTTSAWKQVTGQFSIRQGGRLIGTPDTGGLIAPHAEGLLTAQAVKLSRPVTSGVVKLTFDVEAPFFAPPKPNAVRLSGARYVKGGGGFGTCSLTVTATNTTAKKLSSVVIGEVGLRAGRIVTGGTSYETLFQHTPKIVEITVASPALCPASATARAYWSLNY